MRESRECAHCGLPAPPLARASKTPPSLPAFCCLGCRIAASVSGAEGQEGQARWVQARFLLAGLFSVAVMTLSVILYSDEVFGSDLEQTGLGQLLRWATLALSAPVLLLLAPSLFDPAPLGWRRAASLDSWILLAAGAAWSLSAWRVVSGSGRIYFESASMVLVLVTLGRYLDARAKVHVKEAAARLRDLLPETACLLRGGASRSVPASAVPPGSTIRIRAGERLPLGGKVLEGSAQVDLAAITGEHEPRQAGPGETLPAGAVALDGALDLQVTRVAGNRLLDRVAASLEEARARRTPSMRQAERLTAWLLPAVLLLAGGVLVGQGMFGTWEEGILRALAVLLVSCPCSLGLATPLATWSGIGAALRHGVLVRNGISLEILPRVRTFLFDKTGTLTEGKRRLVSIVGNRSLRGVAAALAGSSAHPAAGALTGKEALPIPEGFRTLPGRGVEGRVEGKRYVFGNRALLSGSRARLAPELEDAWARAEADGFSVVGLGEPGGMARTLFVLEEALRPGTPGILKDLLRNGAEVEVLSGDAPAPCALLARRLGIPIRAGLLPGEKEALVARAARERGPAAFLGDGVNDGPALARADVSAAMAGGTDVARAASDLVFLGEDLRPLPAVLSIARSTLGRIRFNLFWALAYNPLLLFLAASGRLSPVVCALAMSASSLLVTGTSLRPFPAPSPRPEETSSWRPSSTPSFSVS